MRRLVIIVGVPIAAGAALFAAWRQNPRLGTRIVNDVVNPFLVERGIAGAGKSELGTLEHVGRRTGTRHLSPIRPVPTEDGFRIMVPLGARSEWAQNVLAAGHCRMQLHDTVYELDEPVLLAAGEIPEIPTPVAAVLDRVGCEYLLLRRFAEAPGRLEEAAVEPGATPESAAVPATPVPEPAAPEEPAAAGVA
jgi:hypothetical protein